ncbi:MAG: aldehyde dehydrogenase family protein [Gammaproteobacteria bacterium]|nr:aldehyde dehydrogenase family protein [Gammaproteobacteria bacterium]
MLRNPVPTEQDRRARLATLKQLLIDNRQTLRDSVAADFGSHHPRLVDMMETGPVIARVSYIEENLASWMQPRHVEVGEAHGASRGKIIATPKGVTGNISPWNFPVESALVMCADMLAAGNTVMVKPSELAPATAQVIDDAIAHYYDPETFTIVQGGAEVGAAFASMPWDHLTFTGSSRVGRMIMQATAVNLVPVTLELGGKNPAVFAHDGVTLELVKLFLSFRNLKSGQVCTSPDTVYVPIEQLENWIELAKSIWQEAYPTHIGHPDVTGIINHEHFERVVGYIAEARKRDVRVESLNDEKPDPESRQIPMTLIIDPPVDLGCMTDEIFGPVVPVVSYRNIDELITRLNEGPSPLGSYIATHDASIAERFVSTVRSGGAAVNNFGIQGGHVALPFGGFGASGNGCHSAREGFLNYSHTKSVFYGAADSHVHRALEPPIER